MPTEADRQRSDRNRAMIAIAQGEDIAAAESALSTLVQENMGLVRSLSLRFCGRGTDFEDLVQIGTIGMIKAIRSFELERGTAFSTYAVPMIIGEVRRYLRDNNPVRVSRSLRDTAYHAMQIKERIQNDTGRDATIEEIAKEMEIEPVDVITGGSPC